MSSASWWRQPPTRDREFPGQSLHSLTMQRIGLDGTVVESSDEAADAGRSRLTRSLTRAQERGKLDNAQEVLGRIAVGTEMAALHDRELVVEAIVENEAAKIELFT